VRRISKAAVGIVLLVSFGSAGLAAVPTGTIAVAHPTAVEYAAAAGAATPDVTAIEY
jgi:hypothetical protein